MGIGSIKAVKSAKQVPVTETYAQMQARINGKTSMSIRKGEDIKYYDKNTRKVGHREYIFNQEGGEVRLNDGKKTCVATHFSTQTKWNSENYIPIVFDHCYADPQK